MPVSFRAFSSNSSSMIIVVRMCIMVHESYALVKRQLPVTSSGEQLLPAAPDVWVRIAHLSGAGGFEDPGVDEALEVFAGAIGRDDRRMRQVLFDVSA